MPDFGQFLIDFADAVQVEDLRRTCKNLLLGPLSYSVYGEMAGVPSYQDVVNVSILQNHHTNTISINFFIFTENQEISLIE